MSESDKKIRMQNGDKEIIYSKAIKAGKRIYYLDVKKNLKDELFLAVTESKKVLVKDTRRVSFEKHKIFLYKEDFDEFISGMQEMIDYIRQNDRSQLQDTSAEDTPQPEDEDKIVGKIELHVDF